MRRFGCAFGCENQGWLSDLIELWSSTAKSATTAVKESALTHFKEDLEAAALQWTDNKFRPLVWLCRCGRIYRRRKHAQHAKSEMEKLVDGVGDLGHRQNRLCDRSVAELKNQTLKGKKADTVRAQGRRKATCWVDQYFDFN
jgi:hypothetical protein